MSVREMSVDDINKVINLYIKYYNEIEKSCWTEKTAFKRIHQVLTMEDSYSLILEDNENKAIGFDEQNKGYGSKLLKEIEELAVKKGAACIELQAVNDRMHSHFYDKAGYLNSESFVNRVKWFD